MRVASISACEGVLPFSAGTSNTRIPLVNPTVAGGEPTLVRLMLEKVNTIVATSNPTKSAATRMLRCRSHLCREEKPWVGAAAIVCVGDLLPEQAQAEGGDENAVRDVREHESAPAFLHASSDRLSEVPGRSRDRLVLQEV